MRSDLRLYIEGRQVDLSSDLDIAMTYQLEDLTNPTVTKVGYSKTISLQGSQNNNQIFGDIWDLRRTQDYGGTQTRLCGTYFDPSKRAEAKVYCNGELIEDGYIKLDTITKDGEGMKYNCTFYSGLADFFYTFSYDDEGVQRTLASLDFGEDLGFIINIDNVRSAWLTLGGTQNVSKWKKINFAPMHNGLPDNFSSDKAIINFKDNNSFTAPSSTATYRTYQNKGLALAELKKEYTEWEMRDLRSYNQRCVLSVKAFFEALQRTAEAEGWTLELDRMFFNDTNKYYNDAWITLPLLSTLEGVGGETKTGENNPEIITVASDSGQTSANIIWNGDIVTGGAGVYLSPNGSGTYDVSVPVGFKATISNSRYNPTPKLYTHYELVGIYHNYDYDTGEEYTSRRVEEQGTNKLTAQLNAYDGDNNLVASSSVLTLTGGHFEYDATTSTYTYRSGSDSSFNLVLNDINKPETIRFEVVFKKSSKYLYNSSGATMDFYWTNTDEGGWESIGGGNVTAYPMNFSFLINEGNVTFTEFAKVNSGLLISQSKLLASEYSPCDYLLSYAKLYGLYFIKDLGSKTVRILTRNRYFTGDVVDLETYIDHSKTQTITPITFGAKYYNLELETEESKLEKKYFSDYSRVYGSQKINTNYNFDSEIKEIYDGNVFKGGIEGMGSSNYYRHFKHNNWTSSNKIYYPTPMYDSLVYKLVKNGSDLDTTQDSAVQKMPVCNYINFSQKAMNDCASRLCLHDDDNGALEGKDILLFFRGMKEQKDANGNDISYYLTDDVDIMFTLNDNEACWYITDSEFYGTDDRFAYRYSTLPDFGRYAIENSRITYSMDFGEPQELYVRISNTPESTIYSKYWKAFYNDQLDVNTRIFETNVLWNERLLQDCLRKFYFFDNSYWILNKVSDYVLGKYDTVKCEFIKVQDKANYDNGQLVDYESGSITLEETEFRFEKGGVTGYLMRYDAVNVEDLKVTSSVPWMVVSFPESGGDEFISINVFANTTPLPRTGYISLSGVDYGGNTITATCVVTQDRGISIAINPDTKYVSNDGDTFTVEVVTNAASWNYDKSAGWISLDNFEADSVDITVEPNLSGEERSTIVDFYIEDEEGNEYSVQLTIIQNTLENTRIYITANTELTEVPEDFVLAEDSQGNELTCTIQELGGQEYVIEFNGMAKYMTFGDMKHTGRSHNTETVTGIYGLNHKVILGTPSATPTTSFRNIPHLSHLNLNNFEAMNVSMDHFLGDNLELTDIILGNFDTSNMTNMKGMFRGCESIRSLDLSNFDTSNVTNMEYMFDWCRSLRSLDISNFDTSNVTNMEYMFLWCRSLQSLGLGDFDTSNVTNMQGMFECCQSLQSLDLSNFDTYNVTDMLYMLSLCYNLTQLKIGPMCHATQQNLFYNIPLSGMLYYPSGMTDYEDWLPDGWTAISY